MGNPKVSVVLATYNRAHLLHRSMIAYASSSLKDFELIVVDDGSEDYTEKLCKDWGKWINLVYLKAPDKDPGLWRDTASVINQGLEAAKGDVVAITHPEVMIGKDTLRRASLVPHYKYMNFKVYYLTRDNQARLDDVAWEMDLLKVRELPDFYEKGPIITGPAGDYEHRNMETHTVWQSWVFAAMARSTWKLYGKMTEFTSWGSVDVDFLNRRHAAGIDTITPQEPETYVVHQNHDVPVGKFIPTNRDMDAALSNLPIYRGKEDALKGNLYG